VASALDVFPPGVLPPAEGTLLFREGSSDGRFTYQSTSALVAKFSVYERGGGQCTRCFPSGGSASGRGYEGT
jgi:hypothetical protein